MLDSWCRAEKYVCSRTTERYVNQSISPHIFYRSTYVPTTANCEFEKQTLNISHKSIFQLYYEHIHIIQNGWSDLVKIFIL
jgi:hypothetical protein